MLREGNSLNPEALTGEIPASFNEVFTATELDEIKAQHAGGNLSQENYKTLCETSETNRIFCHGFWEFLQRGEVSPKPEEEFDWAVTHFLQEKHKLNSTELGHLFFIASDVYWKQRKDYPRPKDRNLPIELDSAGQIVQREQSGKLSGTKADEVKKGFTLVHELINKRGLDADKAHATLNKIQREWLGKLTFGD